MEKDIFQKLADNLNILMAKKRINASELAQKTGLPPTTIKRYRNNSNANPTLTSLLPIAKYFSLTISQLIGEDPILLQGELTLASKKETVNFVPLLHWQDMPHFDKINFHEIEKKVTVDRETSKKAFSLAIPEADYENLLKDSLIIVDPGVPPKSGDLIIVAKENEEASIKKLIVDDGKSYLKPLLKGLGASEFTPQHRIIGVVMQAKIDFRS